jgi:hypothetical protein
MQKAMDVAAALDLSIYNVTINVGAGSYSGGLTFKSTVGAGTVSFIGDETTPGNVTVSLAGRPINSGTAVGTFIVAGFKLASSTTQDVFVGSACNVTLRNNEYAGTSNYRIYCAGPGVMTCSGSNNKISGGGIGLFLCDLLGNMSLNNSTWTLTANVTYSSATLTARFLGYLVAAGTVFTLGAFSVTGARYSVTVNGAVAGTGGSATFFPGSAAGSTATGGQYV